MHTHILVLSQVLHQILSQVLHPVLPQVDNATVGVRLTVSTKAMTINKNTVLVTRLTNAVVAITAPTATHLTREMIAAIKTVGAQATTELTNIVHRVSCMIGVVVIVPIAVHQRIPNCKQKMRFVLLYIPVQSVMIPIEMEDN